MRGKRLMDMTTRELEDAGARDFDRALARHERELDRRQAEADAVAEFEESEWGYLLELEPDEDC